MMTIRPSNLVIKLFFFFFPREAPEGAHYLSKSLDDALALLDSPELKSKVDMVWIVGGTSVYKVHLNYS